MRSPRSFIATGLSAKMSLENVNSESAAAGSADGQAGLCGVVQIANSAALGDEETNSKAKVM